MTIIENNGVETMAVNIPDGASFKYNGEYWMRVREDKFLSAFSIWAANLKTGHIRSFTASMHVTPREIECHETGN
jgi:hypothetical protein